MSEVTTVDISPHLRAMDDGDLLRRVREGQGAAFRTLYERHKKEAFGFLVRLLGDRTRAEDALQEAFFRVYRSAERFDGTRPFRPWLFRIARNVALNDLRKRRELQTEEHVLDEPRGHEDDAAAGAALREGVARLRRGLDAIDPETRALLVEHYYLGMKPAELGASWDCTERTIRNRLKAAIAILAAVLKTPHLKGDTA